ncbi:MAG: glucose 1-dehydrogenase [Acidimicrobiales bacterium]|nr:glucose 1-dehydrogenase [Acidimicrobiales bacterium]
MMELFQLNNHVAIVTGASRGIGKAIAVGFARAGADVVIGARDEEDLVTVSNEINDLGRRAIPVSGSLAKRKGLEALVETAIENFGMVTTVVNNIGGSMPAGFMDTSEEAFSEALRWNVTTAFNLTQLAVPYLAESINGSVINIASAAGRFPSRGFAAYGTAKAAMLQLTLNSALDLAPRIRVNAIAPGAIKTDALEIVLTNEEIHDAMVQGTPMGRLGEVNDVTAAAIYLASPAASYVTGQILGVDGGIRSSNFDMKIPNV